jgi:hypothetical protein
VSAVSASKLQLIRKFIAGLVAYALAFQLLLPSFALAQLISQASLHKVLCASEAITDDQVPAPVDHQQICPCGPLCSMHEFGTSAGPMPASYAIAWVALSTTYAYPPRLAPDRLAGYGTFTPHNPRAPPAA